MIRIALIIAALAAMAVPVAGARSTDGTIGIQPYGPNRVFFQLSVPHMEPFGYTPCEAHAEGDGVVVRLPDVRSSLKHRPKPAVSPARRSELLPRRPLPPQVAPVPTVAVPPSIDDIRAALALIRRIEAETPYRLVRDGGAWVFDPGLARIV